MLSETSQIIYNNEHTFIIRIQEKPESLQVLKEPELIRVKVIVESEHGFPKYLKIELTSDTEIYFNFVFECNDWEFKRIKANQIQKLMREEKAVLVEQIQTLHTQVEAQLVVLRKLEEKEQLLQNNLTTVEKELRSMQYKVNILAS